MIRRLYRLTATPLLILLFVSLATGEPPHRIVRRLRGLLELAAELLGAALGLEVTP